MNNLNTSVDIRTLEKKDIDLIVQYWFSQPTDFWLSRGVDISKIGNAQTYKENLLNIFKLKASIPSIVIIELNGKPVGHHAISHIIPNESAIFHAHIWHEKHRKRGIASVSYLKACKHFAKEFKLKKIIFKTPKINIGANRLKEKLGINKIDSTIFDSPILIRPLEANLYELNTKELINT